MRAGWRTSRLAESMRPHLRRGACLVAALLASAGVLACSATVIEVAPPTGETDADVLLGNPGTLVPPTVTVDGAPALLAIEPLIAFMDACVGDAGLIGPCHCAAGRIEGSLTVIDLEVFEDRMSGALEFSPELAGALVDCREAPPPPGWSDAQRQTYLDACSAGSDRMRSLCACSLARAQEVIPAHRLNDFLVSNEVQPGFVDFLNLCL